MGSEECISNFHLGNCYMHIYGTCKPYLFYMHSSIYNFICFSSLSEIWTSVLNITGPLSNWSFADNMLPGGCNYLWCLILFSSIRLADNNLFCLSSLAPQTVSGGPPSYICRLSGKSDVDWSFWLEVIIICSVSRPMGITAYFFLIMLECH